MIVEVIATERERERRICISICLNKCSIEMVGSDGSSSPLILHGGYVCISLCVWRMVEIRLIAEA